MYFLGERGYPTLEYHRVLFKITSFVSYAQKLKLIVLLYKLIKVASVATYILKMKKMGCVATALNMKQIH